MRIALDIHWAWLALYAIIFFASLVLRLWIFLLSRKQAKQESAWSLANFEQSAGRTDRRDTKVTKTPFPFTEKDSE